MILTVAEAMVATLKASGVRRVYGIPGDSLNGFIDALRRDRAIAWEHVRHEEAAAFAAAGEAAVTGEVAVGAGSCGPGNLRLINGPFDANRSGLPVLAIAAQIPAEEIGGQYFQETHPQQLFGECSVYCEMASVPEQVPYLNVYDGRTRKPFPLRAMGSRLRPEASAPSDELLDRHRSHGCGLPGPVWGLDETGLYPWPGPIVYCRASAHPKRAVRLPGSAL